jgi:hypothetical protein
MMSDSYIKDPNAVLDYAFDWATEWMPAGDSISTASWGIDVAPDASLTINSTSIVAGNPTAFLGGGTAGSDYVVRCRITTTQGRIDDRSVLVRVRSR